ncbi:MAG: hypothetical protein ACK5Q5_06605 [Planctomycetaceae bacterium]
MTERQLQTLPPEIAAPLQQLDRKVRVLAALRGMAMLVTWLILGLGLALLLDLWLGLGGTTRAVLATAVGTIATWLLTSNILRPLLSRRSPTEVAALVEAAHPELNERLTSTVELLRSDDPESFKGSPLMRQLLLSETVENVRGADLSDSVDGTTTQRWSWAAVAALFLLVVPLLYSRDGYLLLLTRFFQPTANIEQASNLYFVVDRGDRTVARGTDVEILAEPRWRLGEQPLPDEVWMNWSSTDGETDHRRMLWDPDQKLYAATLPHVFHAFEFHVASESARTRDYHVQVVEAPAIIAVVMDIQPPSYTGLPAQRLDGAIGETTVFEHSHVKLDLRFNKPVASAAVEWQGAVRDPNVKRNNDTAAASEESETRSAVMLTSDGLSGVLELQATVAQEGRFALWAQDDYGLTNLDEPMRSLRIQVDQPPTVAFADQFDAPEARPNDVITLPVTAADDIGVHALELHFTLLPAGAHNSISTVAPLLGVRQVETSYRLDLSRLQSEEGQPLAVQNNDRLRLRVRAADERPDPGPNETWSEERTITIRDEAEPYGFEAIAETREQWRQLLQSIRQELDRNRRQVADLQSEATDDALQKVPFDQNEALAPLAAHEREQATRLEQLAALLSTSPLYGTLSTQVQSVAHQELVAAPAAVEQAALAELAQKPPQLETAVTQLDSALAKLNGFEQGLNKIADLERDLAEIQRLAERAQQLSEDAVALDQERQRNKTNLSPERQQARETLLEQERQHLQAEHQQLQGDLSNLLDRRPEIIEAAREQQFDRLRELARQALELATPQEQLAKQFAAEAQQTAADLQSLAVKQQQLLNDGRELAGAVETNQGRKLVHPLDQETLRSTTEALQAGNAEQAAQRQEQAAAELDRLADELRQNELLPDDPQQAALALARRQQQLKTEIEQAAQAHQQARDTLKRQPADVAAAQQRQSAERSLRTIAAAQTAIQAAIANLEVPRNDVERQKGGVRRAFETVQELLDDKPERAIKLADSTRQALEGLANDIGDTDRRSREVKGESRRVRELQEQIAREVVEIEKRIADGETAEKLAETVQTLADRQQQLLQDLARLEVPSELHQRHVAALQRLAAMPAALQLKSPAELATSAREAAQAAANLEQLLEQRPAADDLLADLSNRQEQAARQISLDSGPPSADALKLAARTQRESSQQLAKLAAPLSESERDAARAQLEEAARAADNAATGDSDKLAQAQQQAATAKELLHDLLARVTGRNDQQRSSDERLRQQTELSQAFQPRVAALGQLADQATALAGRQSEIQRQTTSLAEQLQAAAAADEAAAKTPDDSSLSKEQLEQQRRDREQQARDRRQQFDQRAAELRQQQDQLTNEIRQLPADATADLVARARVAADDAREALGQKSALAASTAQTQTAEALEELSAAARGRQQMLTHTGEQSAAQTMQPRTQTDSAIQPTASESLAGRAASLAAEHRELAQAIRSARAQRQAASPSKTSLPPADASVAANTTEPANPALPVEQAGGVVAAQQRLAQQAAEMALTTAEQTGADSAATAEAVRFAQQAARSAQLAAHGDLDAATQLAGEAQATATQAAQQLQAAGPDVPEAALTDQVAKMRADQAALQSQLKQLAVSPAGRSAAQSLAQDRMAVQAEQLSNEFQDVARRLTAQPLDRPQQGLQANSAQRSSHQAAAAIEDSSGNLTAGNPRQASQQATDGANQLRMAAEQALQAAGAVPADPSQVPQSVGEQLAQAMQQLDAAGEQLAQSATTTPSPANSPPGQPPSPQQNAANMANANQSPATNDGNQPSGEPMPGDVESGTPGQQLAGMGEPMPGDGPSSGGEGQSNATGNLQQVAQSLNQAAEQLGLTPGQAQGQRAQNQQASSQGAATMDGDSSDSGAQETLRLTDLDMQLRNISARNWGELPGKLQTEILQSFQHRTQGDYGRIIQRYFEEVSRNRGSERK